MTVARREDEDDECLERVGWCLGGVARDYRCRSVWWSADWKDGFTLKTLSAALFMFFATFSSTVALGVLVQRETHGRIGVIELLLMNSVAGMAHSVCGCQPLLVLRPTGPIAAILIFLSSLSDTFDFNFFDYLAWTGVFCGIYMVLVAALELSRWIRYLTRFTHDLFAFFVCSIYIHDGIQGIVDRFDLDEIALSLFSVILSFLTFTLAMWLLGSSEWRALTPTARSFLKDYALTISVGVTIGISYTFQANGSPVAQRLATLVQRVEVPTSFAPTCMMAFNETAGSTALCDVTETGMPRHWWVGLDTQSGAVLPLVAAATALPVCFFFFMDQNVSSLLTQRKSIGLAKGSYYHSSFLCMAVFNIFGPLFGLPFVTGSLPHSPQLVHALRFDQKCIVGDDASQDNEPLLFPDGGYPPRVVPEHHEPSITRVVSENRIAPLLMYALIGAVLFVPQVIEVLPVACVDAILAFVGVAGLFECELWERILLFMRQPSEFPKDKLYAQVKPWTMHAYTALQLSCLGVCWAVNLSPAGLLFSVVVVLLVPFRAFVVSRMFSVGDLILLDSEDEEVTHAHERSYSLASPAPRLSALN